MQIITREDAKARGLSYYFTGKPCKRGHVARRSFSGPCQECAKEDYHRKYAPINAEKNAKAKLHRIEKARLKTAEFCKKNGINFVTLDEAKANGLPRYFNGQLCKRGHLSERFTNTHHCVECGKERSKEYVDRNPDKRKQTVLCYYYDNYEKEAERRKKYYEEKLAENPNYWKDRWQKQKEDMLNNPDLYKLMKRKAREYAARPDVKERANKRDKQRRRIDEEWRKKTNIKTQLRRRRIRQATPDWLDTDLLAPFYEKSMQLSETTGTPHAVDHYYPIQGDVICGLNVPWNLQVITWKENSAKHNRMPEDFYGPNHTPPTWGQKEETV